jgi:putative tryptophan/tyrosine transport system substrate-binding protein
MRFDQLKRREFITLLGGAAALFSLPARTQQAAMPVVGFLGGGSSAESANPVRWFLQGLAEAGFLQGRNVAIEYLWTEGRNDRLPELALELIRRQVAVIVTAGASPAALAAKAATATIPIVFQIGTDPVELGLVASLNRPGGNITGVTSMNRELVPKRLEVLHELLPSATTIAHLFNPANTGGAANQLSDAQAAAKALGLKLEILHARTDRDFETAFATSVQRHASGLVIAPDPLFANRSELLASLAIREKMPTISPYREFVPVGGLMSYGGDLLDQYRQVGVYTGRVLKGEKPSDLPVEQATKIELLLNLKAARVLGLDVPPTLLARADEVIE